MWAVGTASDAIGLGGRELFIQLGAGAGFQDSRHSHGTGLTKVDPFLAPRTTYLGALA